VSFVVEEACILKVDFYGLHTPADEAKTELQLSYLEHSRSS
jgi:hypothetical protein